MSSVAGGLRRNFCAASSIMQHTKLLVHNEEKFLGMMTGTEILVHNHQTLSRLNTLYIRLPTKQHGNQMHVVPSRPVPAADHFVDSYCQILSNKPSLSIYLVLCLETVLVKDKNSVCGTDEHVCVLRY